VTRYRFIHANRAEFGVRRCCRAVGVSASGFYDWHRRGPSARALADQRLLGQIRRIHAESGGAYGAPRVHAEPQIACGVRVGRKRVARLVRAAELVGCHRRRHPQGLTRRDPRAAPAPDLVKRHFTAARPERLWHADLTELPTDQGKLYLAAVVDGCSRLAVGHATGEHPTAELAIAAVELAVWRRGLLDGDGLVHHSDQVRFRDTPAPPARPAQRASTTRVRNQRRTTSPVKGSATLGGWATCSATPAPPPPTSSHTSKSTPHRSRLLPGVHRNRQWGPHRPAGPGAGP
jgi:transposase InsO family protein